MFNSPLYGEEFVKKSINGDFGACGSNWLVGTCPFAWTVFAGTGRGHAGYFHQIMETRRSWRKQCLLWGIKALLGKAGKGFPYFTGWGHIAPGRNAVSLICSLDFYRTLAELGHGTMPADRKNDSLDIRRVSPEGGKTLVRYFLLLYNGKIGSVRDKGMEAMSKMETGTACIIYQRIREQENVYESHPRL